MAEGKREKFLLPMFPKTEVRDAPGPGFPCLPQERLLYQGRRQRKGCFQSQNPGEKPWVRRLLPCSSSSPSPCQFRGCGVSVLWFSCLRLAWGLFQAGEPPGGHGPLRGAGGRPAAPCRSPGPQPHTVPMEHRADWRPPPVTPRLTDRETGDLRSWQRGVKTMESLVFWARAFLLLFCLFFLFFFTTSQGLKTHVVI